MGFQVHRFILAVPRTKGGKRRGPGGAEIQRLGRCIKAHPRERLPVLAPPVGKESTARIAPDVAQAGQVDGGLRLLVDCDSHVISDERVTDGHETGAALGRDRGEPRDTSFPEQFPLPGFEHGTILQLPRRAAHR